MKKLLILSLVSIATLVSSCSKFDSIAERPLALISISLPSINVSTPATQPGQWVLIQDMPINYIDSVRGNFNVSIKSLEFKAVSPDSLTLKAFSSAKMAVSCNGTSLTLYDGAISQTGKTFVATTDVDITSMLNLARTTNSPIRFAMAVSTSQSLPNAKWTVSTVAGLHQ